MEVSYLINHNGILDNNEAILSIWERQSGFEVGRLREIKYDLILNPDDIQVLDSSFRLFGIDPDLEGNENIPQLTIERGTKLYSSSWDSMRDSTSFGSDSINICTQFIETAGFYIEAFGFGREGVNNRWVKITFGVDEHQDGDSKEESED
ncbi:hypothetical protein CFIMG_003444RA [Ceratocystis fimbriata CBS 114723]|uniref:Uncharacterized protein n=1 Tax=Ceratocystis fimbriata CBS 114723 TaxID=1035309 RepID=A0A2C5XB58_9PEZI|nr:hypothetical protein CFIMG_003444RA [Ceratocystis fimbriata CBS 114723]